jgi:hypothetical protein
VDTNPIRSVADTYGSLIEKIVDIGAFDSRDKLLGFWTKFFPEEAFPSHWSWFIGRSRVGWSARHAVPC